MNINQVHTDIISLIRRTYMVSEQRGIKVAGIAIPNRYKYAFKNALKDITMIKDETYRKSDFKFLFDEFPCFFADIQYVEVLTDIE